MIHVGRHTFFRSLVLAVAYELNIKGAQARLIGAGTDFRVPLILNWEALVIYYDQIKDPRMRKYVMWIMKISDTEGDE
jgi:hypothetical protein